MSCYSTATNEANSYDDDIVTAKAVKDRLKCGLSTVYDLFETGELRGFRLKTGGKRNGIRIFAKSIDELMARNANRAKPALASEPAPSSTRPPAPPRRSTAATPVQAVQGLRHLRLTQPSHSEAPAPGVEEH
jgi:hypothetical protein